MKHYVKNLFDFSNQNSVPTFVAQREHFKCPHCGMMVLVAVPTTGIDWEKVANDYKRYANEMWRDCNQLLAEAGVDTLLTYKLKQLLVKCAKAFENAQADRQQSGPATG